MGVRHTMRSRFETDEVKHLFYTHMIISWSTHKLQTEKVSHIVQLNEYISYSFS